MPLVSVSYALIIISFDRGLLRSRTRGATKRKANAQQRRQAKCPNGCLYLYSRAYDAQHANKTMQCIDGGGRKSYPCPKYGTGDEAVADATKRKKSVVVTYTVCNKDVWRKVC